MIQGGGAAGHIAYAAFRTTNEGTRILPVLQEALTHPLGQPIDIYASPDPYPGPFTVFDRTHAYFLNWCPVCGDTPTASITEVAGANVARYPLVKTGTQTQPLGVSFVDPRLGWVLASVIRDGGQVQEVFITADGGRTWRSACPALGCFRIQQSP